MNLKIFFDTETTGLPVWGEPLAGGENQPHLVQLAAFLVDTDTRKIIDSMNEIIKPDGWSWDGDNEAFKIHGITMEQAMDEGIPEKEALEMFLALWKPCDLRVAFNTTFNNRIIRIATKRYCDEQTIEAWKAGEYFCAMINAKKAMGLSKNPKLEVAYEHFTGLKLDGAHDALNDLNACMEVYFSILDQQKVSA